MSTAQISLRTQSSRDAPEIRLVFWFDGEQIHDWPLTQEPQEFRYEFPDLDDYQHCFEIEMRGKRPEHTCIDHDGNIMSDVVVEIHSVALDDIELGHRFSEQAVYHHDHNGSTDPIQDEFFGVMGCNGRVTMKFHSPVYLWLLENL
jgi:hypothetical protein